MPLYHYLSQDSVLFLKAASRDDALKQMVRILTERGKIAEEKVFYDAIIEREKIVSTGIGMGIAIPHAKLSQYNNFFVAIGVLENPVEWNALDGAPVRAVFLIGGPDDKQTEYLQLLSCLTQSIKDEERRKKIITLKNPEQIIELFQTI